MTRRYSRSKKVVLCMDGDDAGQRAVERLCESPASSGLDSLSEAGVSVSVACIPKDSGCKDPADFLQVGRFFRSCLILMTLAATFAVERSRWGSSLILCLVKNVPVKEDFAIMSTCRPS